MLPHRTFSFGSISILSALLCVVGSDRNDAAVVYTADFEATIGSEWSTNRASITPVGARRFLGDFGTNEVVLTLTNLPLGVPLTLEFDLFVLRTWDGNADGGGPDFFRVDIDGVRVLNTTFKQPGSFPRQSYPRNFPSGEFLPMTGAREINSLGYNSGGNPMNSVYHLSLGFTASNSTQLIAFSGFGLEAVANESWGLDNVSISSGVGPTVSITSPTDQAGGNPPASVLVTANAVDPDGAVTNVAFFANGVLAGIVTSPPYELLLAGLDVGVYRLTVEATDDAGLRNSAGSAFLVGGLHGEYYSARNRAGTKVEHGDPQISFNWAAGFPAIAGFPSANYSVRWTGSVIPPVSETFTFFVRADERSVLRINGVQVVECDGNTSGSGSIALMANVPVSVQLDFENDGGASQVVLEWESASVTREIIPQSRLRFPSGTGNRSPVAPAILVPYVNRDVVHTSNAVFRTVGFSDPDSTNTHAATDWEIWTVNPTGLVWTASALTGSTRTSVTLTNGSFQGIYAGRTDLPLNRRYLLRVRHKDNSGEMATEWSAWAEREFHTLTPSYLIHSDTPWRYFDSGVPAAGNWNAVSFDDSNWAVDVGEFGYGDTVSSDSDARTAIAFGTNAAAKFITTYFRCPFEVREPSELESLESTLICDDGAVVYLNGTEIYRQNMPTGLVTFTSLALAEVPNGEEEYRLTKIAISPSLVLTGLNVLSAEVHLAASNSPDLSFYAELSALRLARHPVVTVAASDFEDNRDNWTIVFSGNSGGNGTDYRFGIGGNPGGHFAYYDDGDAQSSYFNAPAKFRGNLLATAYGGTIELSTKVSSLGRSDQFLRIHAGSRAIKVAAPYVRRTAWLPFRIKLDENSGWRLTVTNKGNYGADLGPASRVDLVAVLSNVTAILIHGEAYQAQDESYIDSVRILAPACDEPVALFISALTNNQVALQWPANRTCLELETTTSLVSASWTTNLPIQSSGSSGGWHTTIVETSGSRFFRLRRN
jgi:hypothetical protein